MEPSDAPSTTDDNVGPSKRRISILKAPRTSIKVRPPEQEECQVEIRKPVEKRRSSRRVSFAPSNDVLLFSKEVKNSPPDRSPLQDLTTMAGNLDQRVQIGVIEDRMQPITGIETLLNAPLHVSQQKNKLNDDDYGEKTVMFTGEETALMDMTHSHTILIANDSESPVTLSDEGYIGMPNCGNMDFTFTMEKNRSLSCAPVPSGQCFDPEFEGFLASLSKSGGPKDTPVTIKPSTAVAFNTSPSPTERIDTHAFFARLNARRSEGNKENKASAMSATWRNCPVGSVIPQSQGVLLNTVQTEPSTGIGLNNKTQTSLMGGNGILKSGKAVKYEEQGLRGRTFSQPSSNADPNDMEMTRSQTVTIDSKTDVSKDHFGDLSVTVVPNRQTFPRVCTYDGPINSHGHDDMELTRSQTVTIDSKSVMEKPSSSKTRKSLSTNRRVFMENDCGMDMTEALPGHIVASNQATKEPLNSLFPTPEIYLPECLYEEQGLRERTFGQSSTNADPNDMEMTRSQTVAIDSKTVGMLGSQGNKRRNVAFTQDLYRTQIFPDDDHGMELTAALNAPLQESRHLTKKDLCGDSSVTVVPNHQTFPRVCSYDGPTNSHGHDDMELTRSQTVTTDSKGVMEKPSLSKTRKSLSTNRGVFMENNCGMDITEALPGHIVASNQATKEPLNSLFPTPEIYLPECLYEEQGLRERTFGQSSTNADPNDMEMTRSQTVAIDSKTVGMLGSQGNKRRNVAFTQDLYRTQIFPDDDHGMELTAALNAPLQESRHLTKKDLCGDSSVTVVPNHQTFPRVCSYDGPTNSHGHDDMELTRSQTVTTDSKGVMEKPSLSKTRKSLSTNGVFMEVCGMEMSEVLPGHIVASSHTATKEPLNSFFPTPEMYKHSGCNDRMETVGQESNKVCGPAFPFRTSKCLSSYADQSLLTGKNTIPPSDQSACLDMKFQFGAAGPCSKTPTSSDSEDMELTRSQTAVESNDIGTSSLEEMEIVGNKSFRKSLAKVNPSCSARMSGDHEMEITKAVPTKIEQPYQTNNMETAAMAISSHLPKLTETTTTFGDLEQKDMSYINNHKPRDEDMELTRNQTVAIESKHIGPPRLEEIGIDIEQKDMANRNDPELRNEAGYIPHKPKSSPISNPASEQDMEASKKAKNRRMSLVDLQAKLQQMSRTINESTEVMPVGSCTAPLSHIVKTSEKSQPTITDSCASKTMELITDQVDNNELEGHNSPDDKTFTTSLNLKSKCFASRLSIGVFLPKLPQRTRPLEQSLTESTRMSDVEQPVKSYGMDVTDDLCSNASIHNINDEVLPNISNEEELSETLNTKSQRFNDERHSEKLGEPVLEDAVLEEPVLNVAEGQKRPFPEDYHDDSVDDEKRRKPCTDQEMIVQWDSNGTTAGVTVDSSSSSNPTNIGCETTFESTYRHSQFESQLEDRGEYMFVVQKKLEDGSITVTEFLKLFSIDVVIHKPRQSILPARVPSDLDRTTQDLLIEKHINHPKQREYETDCQKLANMVEELKVRMRDQDNPLKSVNKALWEAVKGFSEEELQRLGTKLKERRNFFRKRSKVQSLEMKTVLYTNLVQASREAQQNLRGKIENVDELLKNLDEYLHDLETELAVVEGTGVEDCEPTFKSREQGLENVNKSLAESERQMCELEIKKKHSVERLDGLRAETRELENHIAMLDRVNEWKFRDQDDNRTVYTFLHDSLELEVLFEKPYGRDEVSETERNIMNITFQLLLNDEESQCQARLVHKLLSQYFSGVTTWVKKYPTSRYVPKLLHDVGLVVSRCRLLGEEIHMLKKWGSVRLDILDISCVDTQIRILFSSLKAFVKFEITIAVTSAYPFCLLQLQNFQNRIGNTTIHQLEEIVFSVTPSKNYLTKIVKSIHDTLLR